ncbi:MAG: sensor histidine kinase [Flavobacteriales bacterium]
MLNKVNIYWQIVLVTLALLGLVTVQLFWISSAISLRQTEFDDHISMALSELATNVDEIVMSEEQRITQKAFDNLVKKGKKIESIQQKVKSIQIDTIIDADGGNITFNVISEDRKDTLAAWAEGDTEEVLQAAQQVIQGFQQHQKELDNLLKGVILPSDLQGRSNELSVEEIDSLLLDALLNYGIKTEYYFALTGEYGEPIGYKDSLSKEKSDAILKNGYRSKLYRNDFFSNPVSIAVYLPYKNRFVWSSLFWMMVLSLLFVFVLIYVFYTSIKGLLRERHLAAMKNDFINNMTHELKTPISTISLAGEFLTDSHIQSSDESRNRYLGMIKEENQRLGGLVEKVLQSAIIEKGELKLKKEPVNIHEIIRRAAKSLDIQVKNKNGRITLDLKSKNPQLHADEIHLTNMVYNLLDNAIKYTPENPIILVESSSDEEKFMLRVTDNGIGIAKEDQKKIFDKLYRVPTGNLHNVKGFGLGLSYVKAIVEQHGGTVSVKSTLGKGSTFEIQLPYKSISNHG